MSLRNLRNDLKALREQVIPNGGVQIVIRRPGESEDEALERQDLFRVPGLDLVFVEMSDADLAVL